jgi:Glu-tRNA(Gln) amidotransferase subunit E-like FAD-binding protein
MARSKKIQFCVLFLIAVANFAYAQSLGDVARKERARPKPQAARVYTNDDIPSVDLSKEEASTPKDANTESVTSAAKDEDKKSAIEKQHALNEEWKNRVAKEKANVADIEREIDLMQREEKLRVAVYYSDAGNRLRDSKQWDDEQQKFQKDLADKQNKLSEAKTKLTDALEEARKAGATGYE